jgi:hypothetical protein
MIRLSKDKQNKILMIAAGTLVLCGVLWYFIISAQNQSASKYQDSIRDIQNKIYKAEMMIKRTATLQAELNGLRQQIAEAEAQMIPIEQLHGKKWLLDKLNQFILNKYEVTPTSLSNEPVVEKHLLLPKFTYSGASYLLELRAHYHEFGKFLADFENSFPYISIQSLKIWPIATPSEAGGVSEKVEDLSETEREQLKISMKVTPLFKPAGSL